MQKSHTAAICGGLVTLHRLYVGASPDEVGTLAQWEQVLWPIYNAIPFPDLWQGLDVFAVHMDSEQLEDETRQLIANLQDYDTTRAGYQVAAGLYWSKDRLHIGVFPDGWKAEDPPSLARPIPAAAVQRALLTLAHEAGHFLADMCGYGKSNTAIQRLFTALFDRLSPLQAENLAERYAEVARAFFGPPGCRGFFSDGKPYTESMNRPLYSLMALGFWLNVALAGKDVTDLQAWDDRVVWQEWYPYLGQRYSAGWFAYDRQWRKWRWAPNAQGVYTWLPA